MKFKFKKALFSLFMMFLSTLVVYADVPNEITINGAGLRYISAASYLTNVDTTDGVNDGQNLSYKVTTDGIVTYCISPDKLLYTGTLTYSKGDKLNNKILYVLENGYPNKSITGDNDKDYFITNLAVWYLMEPGAAKLQNYNFPDGTYKGASMDVVARAYSLASAANNYTPQTDSLSVGSSNINMTLSSDGNYYVTSSINVNITGNASTYTVTLNGAPTGTKTTDTSGSEKTTFNKGSSFIIKVPVNSISSASVTFRATISANFTNSEAYVYNPNGHDTQSVGLLTSGSSPKTASITLNISGSTNVVISKQDITDHRELAGATLELRDSSNSLVERWTSGTTPHTVEGLQPGSYTLIETVAPNGYILSTSSVSFTINSAGSVSNLIGGKIVMYNEPEPVTGRAYISKRDAATGDELPGAKLVLKNSSGSVVETWTSGTSPHVVNDLAPGRYTLSETIAPDGYLLNTETITFTVGEDGKVVGGTVIMENTPKPVVGKIIVSKRDATTNKGLAGAVLVLKDASGKEIKRWTTTKNTYTIDNLSPGRYTITEISAPKGYILNKEPVSFRVNDDGTTSEGTIIVPNHPEDNPKTGSSLSVVFIIVGLLSLGYAVYTILRTEKNKA